MRLPLGPYQTNCYLVAREGASDAVVVDPGDEPQRVIERLAEHGWTARAILVTHGHLDHIGAVSRVAEATSAPVYMPAGEADDLRTFGPAPYEPDVLVEEGDTVAAAGIEFSTYAVPGHTRASIAYAAEGLLFSGDVLFDGGVGRSDLAGGDHDTLIASIRKLIEALPPQTVVLSGHGPATTLGREQAVNPFLAGLRT
ncbi:MAG: MBL fold metallo-hydrolase [Gaiellales bacterium]